MNSKLLSVTTCMIKQPARLKRSGPITDTACSRWHQVAMRRQRAAYVLKNIKTKAIVNLGVISAPESATYRRHAICVQAVLNRARTDTARYKASVRMEALISEAETALAWQTTATYRRWFSCWRSKGVGVSDLLNMTWSWQQRSVG